MAMLPAMLNLNRPLRWIHHSQCSEGASRMAECRQAANSMNMAHSIMTVPAVLQGKHVVAWATKNITLLCISTLQTLRRAWLRQKINPVPALLD